ncbi:GMC family oxidoreductase N-terminal domain-containing protein [Sphingomonas cavernae]|uniref:FAD-binding protein n=1 Tax=Sphingomonas cavernae TaxID=2320861 RepID=A0A418W7F1_9SPHN|nr:GMC family oxidoreductase N-terminal domain-containing protein [Sphingomonas cavernae]RJF85965.1 FAD-binding protein [Sphingomonas cavernae]
MRRPFNRIQALILRKMAEALFHGQPMAISSRQVVDNLQDLFGNITGNKPREIGLTVLLLGLLLGGPFFIWGSVDTRVRRMRNRLERSKNDLMQDFARLRGIIYAGYYGHWQGNTQEDNVDNPVFQAIGYTLPAHRNRSMAGEQKLEIRTGHDLTHEAFVGHDALPDEEEVIVIGSGAGGGTAAAELAKQGYRVLIVEAGPHYPTSRITHEEKRMAARLFVDGAIQTTRDRDIVVFQGRCVGGSTVINNGICLRVKEEGRSHPLADDVLATWHALGAPINEARLDASYQAVEKALKVSPAAPLSGRNNGPHLMKGWAAYAEATGLERDRIAPADWFRKNWGDPGNACVYCGYCNTGCAYGRKNAMPQSRLREAVGHDARILADAQVTRIRWKADLVNDKRVADGVELLLADGRRHFVRARRGVVVAAGALASSRLLKSSGVANSGKGMSLNIACPVVALMPQGTRVDAWNEDQMTSYVDQGDFLLESHFQPPMSMATLVPGWFGDHFGRMHNYNRLASAGILFPADRCGQMKGGKLSFKLRDDVELPLLRRALATLSKVHFAAGAEEVYPALARGQALGAGTHWGDIDQFFEDNIREADDVTLSSSHPQGGNAIGKNRDNSVIGMDFRVHGTTNVMVTDASVFPSCIRVNAQLTTMAMAHYATADASPF